MVETIQETKKLITFRKGIKSKTDKIFSWNGYEFKNIELLELILQLCHNDDDNYPNGLGGQYFINCMQEIYKKGFISDEIKLKYKL